MTIAPKVDPPQIKELRDRLLIRLPETIQRIIIYGSYARGEAGDESDMDVLVIVLESSPMIVEEIRSVRYEVMERSQYFPHLSLLILSEEDYRDLSIRSAGLKQHIERDGVIIYLAED
jgi:predicted nucleotidyltransferase